jgi:NAD(P)-dependent dehydrogenase (short-subunit alcohol dehydrogenase family)
MAGMSIQGKVTLIAGASGAIGQVIAREFLREGALVALASRHPVRSDSEERRASFGEDSNWFHLDVKDLRSVESVVSEVEQKLGPLAILINASGAYGPIGPVEGNDSAHWEDAVQTNLLGAFNLVHAVVPRMSQHGGGRIIHFSGGGGAYGRPYFSCYSACKAALIRFTESAGKELEERNIYMNAIAPGPVKSGMWEELRSAGPAAGSDALKELESMDKAGGVSAERAARLAVFLAGTKIPLTGKVISAVWDDWENLESHAKTLCNTDAWTLRRVALNGKQ